LERLHAQNAGIGDFEAGKDFVRSRSQGTGRIIFEAIGKRVRPAAFESQQEARSDFVARLIENQRNGFARLNGEACLNGVARSWEERRVQCVSVHPQPVYLVLAARVTRFARMRVTDCCLRFLQELAHERIQRRGLTRKAGTWPPPDVTLARPVALRRVR